MLSDGVKKVPSSLENVPWKLNSEGPFPSKPSVTIYVAVTDCPFSNFLPKNPSPNNISYFSSWTSCVSYISDVLLRFNMLSTCLYFLPIDESREPET